LQQRKKLLVPDISYDLDGDGMVNNRDYFIAKRFDVDQDGKLNSAEKKAAICSLKNGFEDQFYWNVEKSGIHRGTRLLQVRGKIIEADNFTAIKDTYPEYPISKVNKTTATYTELKQKRKQEIIQDFKDKKEKWDKANPKSIPTKYIESEFLVENPKYQPC
jgi:hypothetical protein